MEVRVALYAARLCADAHTVRSGTGTMALRGTGGPGPFVAQRPRAYSVLYSGVEYSPAARGAQKKTGLVLRIQTVCALSERDLIRKAVAYLSILLSAAVLMHHPCAFAARTHFCCAAHSQLTQHVPRSVCTVRPGQLLH